MHLAAAGDDEAVRRALKLRDVQGDVLERLAHEPVAYLAARDELALASGEGAVVHGEGHLHGGGGDLHELDGLHGLGGTDGVAYRDVAYTAHGDDVAGGGFLDGHTLQALELVHGDSLGLARGGVRVVVVADGDLAVGVDGAALYAADRDAADELVVVDGGDEHLEGRRLIAGRLGDVFDDGVK